MSLTHYKKQPKYYVAWVRMANSVWHSLDSIIIGHWAVCQIKHIVMFVLSYLDIVMRNCILKPKQSTTTKITEQFSNGSKFSDETISPNNAYIYIVDMSWMLALHCCP